MMRKVMWELRGNVVGGHTIEDIGMPLAFGEVREVPEERARWSKDLSDALRSKQVLKVREYAYSTNPSPPLPVTITRRKQPAPRPVPSSPPITVPVRQVQSQQEEKSPSQETLALLVKQQQTLIETLQQMLQQGISSPVPHNSGSVKTEKMSLDTSWDFEDDEDEVIYKPQIDSSYESGRVEVEKNASNSASSIEDATQALKNLRRKKKGKE